MVQEIYDWVASFCGVDYNNDELYVDIAGNNVFIDPFQWSLNVQMIIDNLQSVKDVIDQYGDIAPDSLPEKNMMWKILYDNTRQVLRATIFAIEKQLQIDPDMIKMDLLQQSMILRDIIQMCIDHDYQEISSKLFDAYDEENNDALSDVFNIAKPDMMNIQTTVREIHQAYLESIDED